MLKKIVLLSAMSVVVAGCASNPKISSFTPASIVVDYGGSSLYEATRVAQQYCDSIAKDAQYVRTEDSFLSGKKEGFFNCVESKLKAPGSSNGLQNGYSGGPIFNNVTPPVINNNNSH
jgi:hypothetical protein